MLRHRKIYRDNYACISHVDLYNVLDIDDNKIRIFLKKERLEGTRLTQYLCKNIIAEIGNMFGKAYMDNNYDTIKKYIEDNNINDSNILKITYNKAGTRRILIETIQDYSGGPSTYVIKSDLMTHFKTVLPFCLKKYVLQYITDFFISH